MNNKILLIWLSSVLSSVGISSNPDIWMLNNFGSWFFIVTGIILMIYLIFNEEEKNE